jgi:hypothetical protein
MLLSIYHDVLLFSVLPPTARAARRHPVYYAIAEDGYEHKPVIGKLRTMMGKPNDLALTVTATEDVRGIFLSHNVISFSGSGFFLRINIAAKYAISAVTILVDTS